MQTTVWGPNSATSQLYFFLGPHYFVCRQRDPSCFLEDKQEASSSSLLLSAGLAASAAEQEWESLALQARTDLAGMCYWSPPKKKKNARSLINNISAYAGGIPWDARWFMGQGAFQLRQTAERRRRHTWRGSGDPGRNDHRFIPTDYVCCWASIEASGANDPERSIF